jgi:hypothetical protein
VIVLAAMAVMLLVRATSEMQKSEARADFALFST